ncbi:hypothetical protein ACT3UJ_12500 [Halomonas sp. 86]|uniref:hypothetical protein n=1 Tax=unclassified Halomonas TaxID=2609666 RepID=UPI0040335FC9
MLSKATLALVGVLALGLWFQHLYVKHLKEMVAIEQQATENAQARTEVARQQTLEALGDLETVVRLHRLAEADIKALQEELAAQAEGYDTLRQRIQRTPTTDDGPVAPVLRDTLERLP